MASPPFSLKCALTQMHVNHNNYNAQGSICMIPKPLEATIMIDLSKFLNGITVLLLYFEVQLNTAYSL